MQGSKIGLSPAEAALFANAEIILTKNSVLQKTAALLAEVQQRLMSAVPLSLQQRSPPPKISRGENYLGLPYLVLDYPRISHAEGLLFLRSFFWWGRFFSSTLQLSGVYRQQNLLRLAEAYPLLREKGYALGVHPDPWLHHFGADNYLALPEMTKEEFCDRLPAQPHTKLAVRWPLERWPEAEDLLVESGTLLAGLVA